MTKLPKHIDRSKAYLAFNFTKRVVDEWYTDGAMSWSASVAFYTLLSFAPLSILMVAVAGFVYGQDAAQGALVSGLRNFVSPDISLVIRTMLIRPHGTSTSWLAASFGGMVLLFGASSVLTELHDALNAIWHVTADSNTTGEVTLFSLMKKRAYSFIVILGCGTLLLISLMLESWLGALHRVFEWHPMSSGGSFRALILVVTFLTNSFGFTLIYRIIPDVDLDWRDATMGGIVTSLLFMAGKQFISLYISKADLGSAYGAAGSLIVFLVWVYYSAQVFFLGAEFTKVYAETISGGNKSTRVSLPS